MSNSPNFSHPGINDDVGVSDANPGTSGAKIALIFDDGYRSNFVNAAPILREYGFSATVAVEPERVGQNYGGDPATPVVTAEDMRQLISYYGWEIANHPDLDLGATEEQMALDARAENQQLVDLMTGAQIWNGSAYVSATPTHTQYSDYLIQSCVYRAGLRNATSDSAYYSIYDKVRSINGSIAASGDHVYATDHHGKFEQHWTAFPADTNGSNVALQSLLSFVRGLSSTGSLGVIYAHDVPDSLSGSPTTLYSPPPYIPVAHFRELCKVAAENGVQIVPWFSLGRSNMVSDPSFEDTDAIVLAAGSGDVAAYDTLTTLNGATRSVSLTANTFQANLSTTSLTTKEFPVQPFCRYRIRVRYKIDTDLTLNGGPGNVNHGLSLLLTTYQSNTAGNVGGSIDDWSRYSNQSGYSRPYQTTSGFSTMEVDLYTGFGSDATLTVGLFQCTGTVYIGHLSVERIESIVRTPWSEDATYNTTLARNVFLMTPPTVPAPIWEWEFRVQDSGREFGSDVSDLTVDYAFSDSANVPSPSASETCYVVGTGAGAFAGEGGNLATYNGATWTFSAITNNTFIMAGNAEGVVNQYYVHRKRTSEGVGVFFRLFTGVYHDQPVVVKKASNWFAVYNASGTRTDSFTWVARPRWVLT